MTEDAETRPPPASESTNPHPYDVFFDSFEDRRRMAQEGAIVIKGRDLPYRNSRQGRSRYYLHLGAPSALRDWLVFQKDVRAGSGKHRHQGGLVIYIYKGRGWSVFDGVRLEWKEGDLLSLPVKPGGVEHQHFTYPGDEPARWVAFIYIPFHHAMGSMMEQVEERPDWREQAAAEESQEEFARSER
jgi:hypothetical protein